MTNREETNEIISGRSSSHDGHSRKISRRGFFAGVGLAGAASVLASCADAEQSDAAQSNKSSGAQQGTGDNGVIPFDGDHQAGVETPPQANAIVIAYTLGNGGKNGGGTSGTTSQSTLSSDELKKALSRLVGIWTDDARTLCAGGNPLADLEHEMNSSTARMTITFGVSPALINKMGLASSKNVPSWIAKYIDGIPAFSADKLDPRWSGGDVVLQICGDDLTSVSHAARHLTRAGAHYATPRWTQRGFIDSPNGETPRNLLGFKDGTAQPRNEQDYNEAIWDSFGGTAMVVRRVVYDIPAWEELSRGDRELAFGRKIDSGAPLGGSTEFEDVDLSKRDATGLPYIDPRSHVGIAAGQGTNMRRRAFNWDSDITESAESGLIFICFQNDPDNAFTPLQRKLSDLDRMNTWMTHIGSDIFWVVPGTDSESNWGKTLLT